MLELQELVRRFGAHTAVDQLSLQVHPGQLTGFVGANGAGKTTTMRIVMGVLGATSGEVRWHGRPVAAEDRRRFGYMPEERGLYPKMRVREQLVFFARLHGLDAPSARARANNLLDRLGLTERATNSLETLSLGNQQRVQIAAALIHDPTLLVLDEPFSGLDPTAVDSLTGLLREYAAQGVPVLFSSHQLDLVERICDNLVVISHGRLVITGSVQQLREQHAGRRYRVQTDQDTGWLAGAPGVASAQAQGPTATVQLHPDTDEQQLIAEILRRGKLLEFSRLVPSLADIFREVTR